MTLTAPVLFFLLNFCFLWWSCSISLCSRSRVSSLARRLCQSFWQLRYFFSFPSIVEPFKRCLDLFATASTAPRLLHVLRPDASLRPVANLVLKSKLAGIARCHWLYHRGVNSSETLVQTSAPVIKVLVLRGEEAREVGVHVIEDVSVRDLARVEGLHQPRLVALPRCDVLARSEGKHLS